MAKTTPKVGDRVLLHGERHVVESVVGPKLNVAHPKQDVGHAMLGADLVWNEKKKHWELPGRTDPVTPGQAAKLVPGPAPKGT